MSETLLEKVSQKEGKEMVSDEKQEVVGDGTSLTRKHNERGAGRKKKYKEGEVVLETFEPKKDEVIEISTHKAKQTLKTPRVLSEKQKENVKRLIELNRIRREEAKKQAEEKLKQEEEEKAKLVKKTYIIKPKRQYNKKVLQTNKVASQTDKVGSQNHKNKQEQDVEENRKVASLNSSDDEYDSEDDNVPQVIPTKPFKKRFKPKEKQEVKGDSISHSEDESTDTREIKKKINKLKTIDNQIKQVQHNPYIGLLQKAGF